VLNMALVLVLHNCAIIIIIIIIIIGLMSCYMQWLRAGNSVVGIATCYGLDGPGIEFRCG
jgi:type IV secretory pathway VirB2 component (pilin)